MSQTPLSRNLKTWLTWAGLQQGHLAAVCRMSSSLLSRSLRLATPQPWLMRRLAHATGLPAAQLLSPTANGELLRPPPAGLPRDVADPLETLDAWTEWAGALFALTYDPGDADVHWGSKQAKTAWKSTRRKRLDVGTVIRWEEDGEAGVGVTVQSPEQGPPPSERFSFVDPRHCTSLRFAPMPSVRVFVPYTDA